MLEGSMKLERNLKPYLMIMAAFVVFAGMFAFNFILPSEKSLLFDFYNINNRVWHWCELLICVSAVYYIFKIRKLSLRDLSTAVVLGTTVYFANSVGYGYISAVVTAVAYYSACQIFRFYSQQNKTFNIGFKKILKSFGLGVLYAIPFAVINNLAIYFSNGQTYPLKISRIIPCAWSALAPGISEEIIFHFFLLAFATALFKGKIDEKKSTKILVYFLLVVPHCLIHLPTIFIENPSMALFILAFTSILFGFPMAWLVKNKNLQTAIVFHWFIDFIRFLFVRW